MSWKLYMLTLPRPPLLIAVTTQGDKDFGGVAPAGLTNVVSIISNLFGFAALTSGHTLITWGEPYTQGSRRTVWSMTYVKQNIRAVYSSDYGYIAVPLDSTAAMEYIGYIATWDVGPGSGVDITSMATTNEAFGYIHGAGDLGSIGSLATHPTGISNAVRLFSARSAICALRSDHTVMCFGPGPEYGSEAPANLQNVLNIASNYYAFAALIDGGTVIAWGK